MAHFPIPDHLAGAAIPLWNQYSVPLSRGTSDSDLPTITPTGQGRRRSLLPLPSASASEAVSHSLSPVLLIIPGGGYLEHAFDNAMIELAESYERRGVATFILRYRLASDGYHHPCQMLDASRAVRLLRARAAEWRLDPQRIGVMGFSAGGHLASMLAALSSSEVDPAAADPIDRESARPNAAVLIYPVISMLSTSGSSNNLFGPRTSEELAELRTLCSTHLQVTSRTPPTLLVHGEDDATVSIQHSRLMFQALQRAGIPSAFHDYPAGKHGFGCFAADPCPRGWLSRVDDWLHHVAQWRELM